MRLSCTINGEPRHADDIWEGESLLYVLRERLGLPGSKNACEQGECGSCSVYLDGVLVCACLVLAGQAEGAEIVTVEGLATDDGLHPVQDAFVEAGAVQCGFCTPGLVVATHDLLRRNPSPSDPEVREALAGNLCRCTGYEKILDAVRVAAERVGLGGSAEGRVAEERLAQERPAQERLAGGRAAGDRPDADGPAGGHPRASGQARTGVWTAASTPSDPGLPSRSGAPRSGGSGDARPGAGEGGP
jgi:aerobic carbon-monoxide dehydrogenase small subunit